MIIRLVSCLTFPIQVDLIGDMNRTIMEKFQTKKKEIKKAHNVNKNNIFNHLPQNNVFGFVPYLMK